MRGRSVDDEQLLQAIIQSNPNSPIMYIVDTRPKVSNFTFQYCYTYIDSLLIAICQLLFYEIYIYACI